MDQNLRKLQLAELGILFSVAAFLDENKLDYYINYGTLLGAVRHKGFIPWDDDIDICMPRPDYEKLLELCRDKSTDIYFTEYRLGNSLSQILQAVDPNVSARIKIAPDSDVVLTREAWIDIFPIDGMPENKILREIHGRLIFFNRFLWGLTVNDAPTKTDFVKGSSYIVKKIIYFLRVNKLFDRDRCFSRLQKLSMKYSYDTSSYVVNPASLSKMKDIIPKEWICPFRVYDFEGRKIKGPANFDLLLRNYYGEYMTPPPEDSPARNHHNLLEVIVKNE